MFLNTFHLCLFSFFSVGYYFLVYLFGVRAIVLSLLMTNVFHALYMRIKMMVSYVLCECVIIYFVLAGLTYIWLLQIDCKAVYEETTQAVDQMVHRK